MNMMRAKMEEQLFSSDSCEALKPVVGLPCIFCGSDKSNEFSLGKLIHQDGFTVHYYCMLFSCGLAQQENVEEGILGFCYSDLKKEYLRGRRLNCFYCKKRGATVGCCYKKCRRGFHLSCGQRNGTLHQFFGMFRSFCDKHRPMQNITVKQSRKSCVCPICFERVENKAGANTLWASCCNVSWFHRDCIQMQALSAGYFFKCPLCNNCEDFKKEMETYGIYIPEKDAAWELVDNAYEDLLFRYSHCDAPCCLCPKGRKHKNNNQWEIVLCDTCGSAGCHRECGMLTQYVTTWECSDCQNISQKIESKATVSKPTRRNRSRKVLPSTEIERTLKRESPSVPHHKNTADRKTTENKVFTKLKEFSSACEESNDSGVSKQFKIGQSKDAVNKTDSTEDSSHSTPSDEPPKLDMYMPNSYNSHISSATATSCEPLPTSKQTASDSSISNILVESDTSAKQKRTLEVTDEDSAVPAKKHCDCGNYACIKFMLNYFKPSGDDDKCTTASH